MRSLELEGIIVAIAISIMVGFIVSNVAIVRDNQKMLKDTLEAIEQQLKVTSSMVDMMQELVTTLKVYAPDNKEVQSELENTIQQLLKMRTQLEELLEFLDPDKAKEHTITGYAPLDPNAVYGMDYIGDPTVTASGAKVVPGVTAAAGPAVPFGTKLYIPGIGWRIVQDRGSAIGNNHIDIAMPSRASAIRFGKQRLPVLVITP